MSELHGLRAVCTDVGRAIADLATTAAGSERNIVVVVPVVVISGQVRVELPIDFSADLEGES